MSDLLTTAAQRDQDIATLLRRLPDLAGAARLTDGDVRAIRYLASRPPEMRTARCPVCVTPGPSSGIFRAETDADLFAQVASHTMQVHNGGPVDAFNTAESVLPHVGLAYRKDAGERPWLYQPKESG